MWNKFLYWIKKGFTHEEWIEFLDKIVNFLVVFGATINLIIWGLMGFQFAKLTSFFTLMLIGVCRLSVNIIKYVRKEN